MFFVAEHDGVTHSPEQVPDKDAAENGATAPRIRQLSSGDILRGEREVWIVHGQDVYRLRETKNGKLILQK